MKLFYDIKISKSWGKNENMDQASLTLSATQAAVIETVYPSKEIKRGNCLFLPFCIHTWRGVKLWVKIYLVSGFGTHFLFACIFHFTWTHIMHTFTILCGKCMAMIMILHYNNSTLHMTTKIMAAAAVGLQKWSERELIPFSAALYPLQLNGNNIQGTILDLTCWLYVWYVLDHLLYM